jgi:FHS family L-fucose permease-like MFS transporter
MSQPTKWNQFGTLICVFFFWGFVAASNDILIPVFKKAFDLSQAQSQLVSVAFYVAYTVGSIIYMVISAILGKDLINVLGYKNGIALGLVISAIGTLLFYPAANNASFILMISGLFIVGLGFSLQQIAANPLAVVMGDPKTGSQRLSMAGGINNLGTTIGPLLVSYAIFGRVKAGSDTVASIESVKIPYLILGIVFILVAILFKYSSIPNTIVAENSNESTLEQSKFSNDRKSALHYPQLWMGMIAIFVYVGVEVSTASNLPEYLRQHFEILNGSVVLKSLHLAGAKEFTNDLNAPYISLYWASLMIGRWASSAGAFNLNEGTKIKMNLLLPIIAFGVFLLVNFIAGHPVEQFYPYLFVIIVMMAADAICEGNPARMLLIFSSFGISALVIGMFTTGLVSVFAFTSVGLFCSTLWPCIFTLAVAGLGKNTNQGSSYLIMMIMGGGLISLLQGTVSSNAILGIKFSYVVGVACFAYLAFYAYKAKNILHNQGIDYDTTMQGGH